MYKKCEKKREQHTDAKIEPNACTGPLTWAH